MLNRSNANKEKGLKWNPLGIFRQNYSGNFPAHFSLVSRAIHIQFSLNCRLLLAPSIFCYRIADVAIILQLRHSKHKKSQPVLKQRIIESNQFDNLSPPRFNCIRKNFNTLKNYVQNYQTNK